MTGIKKIQIIATGITTLDEARYFAAMGADWIGFDAIQLNAVKIKTIGDWVVGPKMFIEMQAVQEDLLFEISSKMPLHGICLPLASTIPAWYSGQVIRSFPFPSQKDILDQDINETLIIRLNGFPDADEVKELYTACMKNTCWIEMDTTQSSLIDLCMKIPMHGIVIRCREEAKSGDDVFAQYNSFFEEMEKIGIEN